MKFKFVSPVIAKQYPEMHRVIVETLKEVNAVIKNGKVPVVYKTRMDDPVIVEYDYKGRTNYTHHRYSAKQMKKWPDEFNRIRFNLNALSCELGPWFMEYKSFGHKPVIGNVVVINNFDRLRRIVLHEAAHMIQWYLREGLEKKDGGHKAGFQETLRLLILAVGDIYIYDGTVRDWNGARFGVREINGRACIYTSPWKHNADKITLPNNSTYYELKSINQVNGGFNVEIKPYMSASKFLLNKDHPTTKMLLRG
jgi:hypothetical protein